MTGLFNCCTLFGMVLPSLVLMPMVWSESSAGREPSKVIPLPEPRTDGTVSVEEALQKRRSERDYADETVKLEDLSQLLWAAQGITDRMGLRTAPSAGALYPLEVYVVVGNVEGMRAGIYKYQPLPHRLLQTAAIDLRAELASAALGQSCVKTGAASIVFTAFYERTTRKYDERGIRYVHMEAGHAAQNVSLQAVSLNLATVVVGAFHDKKVQEILGLPRDEAPLIIMPIGKRR